MLRISNLEIQLDDTNLAKSWLSLYQSLNVDPDMIIDNSPINDDVFAEDIRQANSTFGLDWPEYPKTQAEYNKMHKDLELASPKMADKLQYIHNRLHVKESQGDRSQIQISWSDSLGQFYKKKPINQKMTSAVEPFSKEIKYGDVYLGYPHVGKSPQEAMRHNDNKFLKQTCKLHDTIVCDILISLVDRYCDSDDELIEWYDREKITFFSKEDMLKYNGWPKIGHVVNKNQIMKLDTNNLKSSYNA